MNALQSNDFSTHCKEKNQTESTSDLILKEQRRKRHALKRTHQQSQTTCANEKKGSRKPVPQDHPSIGRWKSSKPLQRRLPLRFFTLKASKTRSPFRGRVLGCSPFALAFDSFEVAGLSFHTRFSLFLRFSRAFPFLFFCNMHLVPTSWSIFHCFRTGLIVFRPFQVFPFICSAKWFPTLFQSFCFLNFT